MPNELELCAVSAVIGALIGGAVAYTVTHKIDGAALAHEQAARANDIARINATAAKQLADAIAKGNAAQGRVSTLEQQYQQEIAQHAKDSLDYRAKLLNGTEHVRVRVAGCSEPGTGSKGTAAPGVADGSPVFAILSGPVAAGVFTVADDADATAAQLRALQQYVTELQNDGYISK